MAYDLQQAIDALADLTRSGPATPEQLLTLVRQVSVEASGALTVLYTGRLPDGGESGDVVQAMLNAGSDIRAIDETDAAHFLNSREFRTQFARSFGLALDDLNNDALAGTANAWLFHATDGPWADASKRFAAATTGEVRIIAFRGNPARILGATELPTLLANSAVTSIEGMPVSELNEIAAKYGSGSEGLEQAFKTVRNASEFNIAASGLTAKSLSDGVLVNIGDFLDSRLLNFQTYVDGHPEAHSRVNAYIDGLSAAEKAERNVISRAVLTTSEGTRLSGGVRVLNKVGAVGAILSLYLATNAAQAAEAAGDSERAKEIMKEWAVDAAGSEVGSAIGATVGAIALGAAAVAGVAISAPLAGALVLGGALVGGIFGGDAGLWLYRTSGDRDGNGNIDFVDALYNLFVGPTTTLSAPLPPDLNGETFTIDSQLTREELFHNAKDSIAWRYALRELNSFVVTDVDYARHNTDGSLDLAGEGGGHGMTEQYLSDRAAMLAWKLKWDVHGARDDDDAPRDGQKPYNDKWDTAAIAGNWDYIDLAHTIAGGFPLSLTVDGKGLTLHDHQIAFGTSGNDVVSGAGGEDHLYGMAGNDQLDGLGGYDHLEGGVGNDILNGGDGADTLLGGSDDDTLNGGTGNDTLLGGDGLDVYQVEANSGLDTVIDADGRGGIWLANRQLTGSGTFKTSSNGLTVWVDESAPDAQVTYLYDANRSELTVAGAGSTVIVKDFQSGELGITVPGAPVPAPAPTPDRVYDVSTSAGSTAWSSVNGAASTLDIRIENAANPDPHEYVGYTTGSGDDTIIGGASATANQTGFYGGAGNDRIFSGTEASLADAIAQGETQGSTGRGVYLLVGDEGEDQVIGAADNDVLFGGDGDDTLVGGGGSDIIFADGSAEGMLRTTMTDGSTPTWVLGSNDPLNAEPARLALLLLLARRGLTTPDTTGRMEELWEPLVGAINPLSDTDLSGLLAMQRADIHPAEGDPTNLEPDSQRTYAELTGGKYFGTNVGHGDDVIHAGAGDDVVNAGAGNDIVFAGTGKDMVAGYDGNDVIEGGAGDDRIYGDYAASVGAGVQATETHAVFGASYVIRNTLDGSRHGNDQLDGGDGDDVVIGGGGSDNVWGDAGNDILYGDDVGLAGQFSGEDYVDGGDGDDALFGGGGSDQLEGGSGADYLVGDDFDLAPGYHGDDYLNGDAGDDELHGGGGNDQLFGGTGADLLYGDATESAQDIIAAQGDDYLDGEEGDDTLIGEGGSDVLVGGDGADRLYGDSTELPTSVHGNDLLLGGSGKDQLFGHGGNDTLDGGDGDDYLDGGADDDALQGAEGEDVLRGGAGNDTLNGGAGRNTLDGGAGNDTLISAGLDYLDGGEGDDTYRITLRQRAAGGPILVSSLVKDTQGSNTIVVDGGPSSADDYSVVGRNGSLYLLAGQIGAIELADDIDLSNTSVATSGGNVTLAALVLRDNADGMVRSMDFDAAGSLVSTATISQSQTLTGTAQRDLLEGGAGLDFLVGGAGSDRLEGGAGSDDIAGGAGADVIVGGAGNDSLRGSDRLGVDDREQDVYLFNLGDGIDWILPDATPGLAPLDVIRFGTGIAASDVYVANAPGSQPGTPIIEIRYGASERIELAAGAEGQIARLEFADGTSVEFASLLGDSLQSATPGADLLFGTQSADTLDGGAGDDQIRGLGGDDTLTGGDGDDLLVGGSGRNTYVFRPGWGSDIIRPEAGETGQLQFANGTALRASVMGDDLVVAANDVDTVRIEGYASDPRIASEWQLTVGDQTHSLAEFVLSAPPVYDDSLDGRRRQFIAEQRAQLRTQSQYYPGFSTNDGSGLAVPSSVTQLAHQVSEGTPLVYTPYLAFSTRTVTTTQALATPIYQTVQAPVAGTSTTGTTGAIYVQFDPTSNAGAPFDPYWLIVGNIAAAPTVTQSRIVGWQTTVVEQVTTQTADAAIQELVTGTSGGDSVEGSGPFRGVIETGDGDDRITLQSGPIGPYEYWYDRSDWGPWLKGYPSVIQNAEFYPHGLGAWIDAGAGADRVSGTDGNDVILGGAGSDWLDGQAGADTYLVGDTGADVDRISDLATFDWQYESSYYGIYGGDLDHPNRDVVEFDATVSLAELSYRWTTSSAPEGYRTLELFSRDRLFLQIDYGLTDGPPDRNISLPGVERFRFADGQVLDRDGLLSQLPMAPPDLSGNDTLQGTVDADTLDGEAGNDVLFGLDGDDVLFGGEDSARNSPGGGSQLATNADFIDGGRGNDLIDGGSDSDTLLGGEGNDTLLGGADLAGVVPTAPDGSAWVVAPNDDYLAGQQGDDLLEGGSGFDRYGYERGDGIDRIVDTQGSGSIEFGTGIRREDIAFRVEGNDLVIDIAGAGDVPAGSITLVGWRNATERIDNVYLTETNENLALNESVLHLNTAPVAVADSASLTEDQTQVSGNVLANDTDPDVGDLLTVANAGTFTGSYGTLSLAANGTYTYTLDTTRPTVQALAQGQQVVETFAISIQDSASAPLGTESQLQVTISGANDSPTLVTEFPDVSIKVLSPLTLDLPSTAFNDVDQGDAPTWTAILSNGDPLPGWLTFDPQSHRLSGTPPRDASGSALEIRITATDGSAETASDLFRISIDSVGLTLLGSDGDDALSGSALDDTLDGGAGTDTLAGGAGDDVYVIDRWNDVVVESPDEGEDTVQLAPGFVAQVQSDGMGGTMAFVYVLPDGVENVLLGQGVDAWVQGNALANSLTGNDLDNYLDGGAGVDRMEGGLGNDAYFVDDSRDVVIESDAAGDDGVISSVDFTLPAGIEQLMLAAPGISGTGNALDNVIAAIADGNTILDGRGGNDTLFGGDGDDVLIATEGDDRMVGGAGNDTYEVDSMGGLDLIDLGNGQFDVRFTGDLIFENVNNGTDLVRSSVTYSIASLEGIENLTLIGTQSIDGTGNDNDNVLTGNEGANTLNGGAGNDTFVYGQGGGTDIVVDDSGNDTLRFDEGLTRDRLSTRIVSEADGNHVLISILGSDGTELTGQRIEIRGTGTIENYAFASGSSVTLNDLLEDTASRGVSGALSAGVARANPQAATQFLSPWSAMHTALRLMADARDAWDHAIDRFDRDRDQALGSPALLSIEGRKSAGTRSLTSSERL